MVGYKKLMAMLALMVLVVAFAAPVMAQTGAMQGQPMQQGQGQGQAQAQAQAQDLMTTIDSTQDISIFSAALKAAGDDKMLSGQGPYMVFAPSDKALQRDLGIESAQDLQGNDQAVKDVVDGSIVTAVKVPGQEQSSVTLTAINGKKLVASKAAGGITVNGIKSVDTVPASNGILVVTDGIV